MSLSLICDSSSAFWRLCGFFCFWWPWHFRRTLIKFSVVSQMLFVYVFPWLDEDYGFVKNTTGVMLHPFLFFFFFFHASCRTLVSRPTLKPVPSALGAWSPVHWTAREFLGPFLCIIFDRIRIGWTAKKFEEFLWFITVTMKSVILFIYSINIEFYLCPPTANIKQRW